MQIPVDGNAHEEEIYSGKEARNIKVQQDPRFNAMHSHPTPYHPIPA